MRLALVLICLVAAAQSREDLIAQQRALNEARHETDADRAAGFYQKLIDRYGGDAVWAEIARRGLFATMIETQVKLENWKSAEQLCGAAIQRPPISDEPNLRRRCAGVLDHLHK